MSQRKLVGNVLSSRSLSAVFLILPLVAAGCAGAAPEEIASSSVAPATEPEDIAKASAVSAEQLATAAAVGDIVAGEELFNQPIDGITHSWSCSSCHSLDGKNSQDGPTLAGVSGIAADRIEGLSAVDYLRQSIVDPYAFRADGEWRGVMPHQYPDLLSVDEIDNLIAFLLTQ